MSDRVSPAFPPSDADFVLKSCDKVLFHVHRVLLCLGSTVFRDAFEIWTRESNPPAYSQTEKKLSRASSLEPATSVELAEDSHTIECLLSFLYPNVQQPNPQTLDLICSVLRAAHKYGMSGVLRRAANLLIHSQQLDEACKPFYKTNPLQVYAIARELSLKTHANLAAHESLRIRLGDVEASKEIDNMPTKYYRELIAMRKERKAWMKNSRWWIMSGTVNRGSTPHSSCQCAAKQTRDIPHEIKRTLLKTPCVETVRSLDLAHYFPCLRCLGVAHVHFSKLATAFDARFPSC